MEAVINRNAQKGTDLFNDSCTRKLSEVRRKFKSHRICGVVHPHLMEQHDETHATNQFDRSRDNRPGTANAIALFVYQHGLNAGSGYCIPADLTRSTGQWHVVAKECGQ